MSEHQSALKAALEAFVERLKSILHRHPGLGANQVEVVPGGAKFTTIAEALKSITDASHQKEYTLYVGPGVYEESVVCKPWVFIEGSGPDVTTIRAPLGVTGASNSSIGSLTVDAGTKAILCSGTANFAVANCVIISSDRFGPAISNYEAVSVDFDAAGPSPSSVDISYSTLQAQVQDTLSTTVGVVAGANAVVLLNYCKKITAAGGGHQMGCAAGNAAAIRLYDCSVGSRMWALRLLDDSASIIATQCTIDGQVSPGVIINKAPADAPPDLPPPHDPGRSYA